MFLESVKSYLKIAAIVYVMAVTGATAVCLFMLKGRAEEISRLRENQNTLLGDIREYETRDGRHVVETRRLQMTIDEYRRALEASEGMCAGQEEVISSLGLKVRRLESMQQTTTVMSVDTTAAFVPFTRDTLTIPKLVIKETPVCLMSGTVEWSDPWVSVRVRVAEGMAAVNVSSVDTLYQIMHRVPRRFLGIPFGTKAVRQEVTGANPHSRVVFSEYIELKRR